MFRVSLIAICVVLVGVAIHAAQDVPLPAVQPAAAAPAGLNIIVYQRPGSAPAVIHLHGASGDVHIWIVEEAQPGAAGAPLDEESKKLAAIKKAREEGK